jgi:CBS domain containing-hemolysin-like protein
MNFLKKCSVFVLDFIACKTLKDPFYQSFKKLQETVKDTNQFEKDILNNVFNFIGKTVNDVMIPRSDICAAHIDSKIEELYKIIASKGHTRTLIYRDTLDDIIGFVHIKDLYFDLMEEKKLNLRNIIRKPIMIVKSMKLIDLLKYMQQQRTHIACVVDEYGGIDGIVTLEDVISELIGPMNDEHEIMQQNLANYEIIDANTFLVNARMEIEDLEKVMNIKLRQEEDDDFDTIGGLILSKAGYMPKSGEIVRISDLITAEIIISDSRAIKKVKLTLERRIAPLLE